ncbi:unnamed protein product [Cylicocyclus nassatus]|uniref:Uncharacterized protein n=1 Tax=Cylicocyclus nassatus TaxID=53992 RepID=A0AA36MFN9_CYLNA|nr:unnamed protein product [Cylicocyclus nassatus]
MISHTSANLIVAHLFGVDAMLVNALLWLFLLMIVRGGLCTRFCWESRKILLRSGSSSEANPTWKCCELAVSAFD